MAFHRKDKLREQVKKLRAKGMSYDAIAKKLGLASMQLAHYYGSDRVDKRKNVLRITNDTKSTA